MGIAVRKIASKAALAALASYSADDVMVIVGTMDVFAFDASSSATHDGTDVIKPTALLARKAGRWLRKKFKLEDLDGSDGVPAHASAHEDGGADEIDVTDLSGVLADPQIADTIHETDGPTDLVVGDVADGYLLKRVGSTVVGVDPASIGGDPYTHPVAADFTALNSASLNDVVTDLGAAIHVHGDNAGGTATANMKGGEKNIAYVSGTKTLIVGMLIQQYAKDYNFAGVYFRDSVGGKLMVLCLTSQGTGTHKINVSKWPSVSGGGAGDYADLPVLPSAKMFFKLSYDGTNLACYWSIDLVTWTLAHTVAKTDYLDADPDKWGFFINQQNATLDGDISVFHLVG